MRIILSLSKILKYLTIRQKEEESGIVAPRDSFDLTINTKRWMNVLFSQSTKHQLATRGGTLTRSDLQNHRSTDQGLHESLLVEYNIQGKYDEHAFSDVVDNMDASIFDPIPTRYWQKSNDKLKAMTKEYESKILACTASGFNGNFEDIDKKSLAAQLK